MCDLHEAAQNMREKQLLDAAKKALDFLKGHGMPKSERHIGEALSAAIANYKTS
jgi:hypothetical protein